MFSVGEQNRNLNTGLWDAVRAALAGRDVRLDVTSSAAREPDLIVRLTTHGHTALRAAEVKKAPTAAGIARSATRNGERRLLIVPHMTRSLADTCRELGVDYVDGAGNMLLDLPGRHIEVTGRRPAQRVIGDDNRSRLFRASGVRVVFALLCAPELVARPYRTLAEEAGVSLGSAQAVMSALIADGYVVEPASGRRLHRTRRLFERWVEAYDVSTRSKLSLGAFDTDDPAPWLASHVELGPGAWWGGENAAALTTKYLRPGHATVYVDELPRELVRRRRLRRAADQGLVEFRRRFWGDEVARSAPIPSCAPTPLVYADLVASAEPRLLDAADRLRETDGVLRRIDER